MSTNQSIRRLSKVRSVPTTKCSTRNLPILVSKSLIAAVEAPAATIWHNPRSYSSQSGSQLPSFKAQDGARESETSILALEEELLAIQNAAIAELESQLGKTLEEAATDGQLESLLESYRASELSKNSIDQITVEATESPLSLLRTKGAPAEDIAREARNIFREYLPQDTLSSEELMIYKRLYGEPLSQTDEELEGFLQKIDNDDVGQVPDHILFDAEGAEVPYHLESRQDLEDSITGQSRFQDNLVAGEDGDASIAGSPDHPIRVREVAQAVGGELVDEENLDYEQEEDELSDAEDTRSHPLTKLGRFATHPRTTFLPRDAFVRPVQRVMSDFSNRQLREMCERTFGGPGLPDSPLTPRSGHGRQQVPVPLEASQQSMGQMEANAFLTSVMPPTYASISATLVETRKRLGSTWMNKLLSQPGGPRVLDAGSGGVGIVAWKEIVKAHWEALHTSDKNSPPPPESKSVVLTGSDALRQRVSTMLENTTFVPRLPDYVHTRQAPTIDDDRPAQRKKQFDIIIASHSLFPLKEDWERKQHVQNLWSLLNDEGGILIMIEKGVPRGFEAIAAAREMLLENHIVVPDGHTSHYSNHEILPPTHIQKGPGMIVAPCTNHNRCPLFKASGVWKGRKDLCSFQQRYIRPPFLQNLLGAKDRNHDDVDFSYLSVMKGDDLRTRTFSNWSHVSDPLSAPRAPQSNLQTLAETHESNISQIQHGFEHIDPTWSDSPPPPPIHTLPRIINQPLKRQRHITIDLCTPQAEIRRWTIPKSFSRQAYRDARKARWGDLWALGAKTSVVRNLKVGVPAKEYAKGEGLKDNTIEKPRSRKERLEMQAVKVMETEAAARTNMGHGEEDDLVKLLDEQEISRQEEEDNEAINDGLIDMDTLLPKKPSRKQVSTTNTIHRKSKPSNLPSINQSPSSSTHAQRQSKPATSSPPSSNSSHRRTRPPIDTLDYSPGRYGEEDNLRAWAAQIDRVARDDETRKARNDRRASAKNTTRAKRDIRRVRRERQGGVGYVGYNAAGERN